MPDAGGHATAGDALLCVMYGMMYLLNDDSGDLGLTFDDETKSAALRGNEVWQVVLNVSL